MVRIIEEQPRQSFFQKLNQGVGSALQEAPKLYESYLNKQKEVEKKRSKIRPGIKSFLSLYDKNKAFDPEMIGNLEKLSHKYLDLGLSSDDAIGAAYQEILSSPEAQAAGEKADQSGNQRSFIDKLFVPVRDEEDLKQRLKQASEDVEGGFAKGARPFVQALDLPYSALKGLKGAKRKAFDRILGIPEERTREREEKISNGSSGKSLTDLYDQLTEGKGKPQNLVERILGGTPFGPAGIAGSYVEEGLRSAGLPESVQHAGNIVTMILSHKINFPGADKIASEAEKIAKATGRSPEEVVSKAARSAGVDLESVASGDAQAAKALNKELSDAQKVASKVKETPKSIFNKKAAEKEREVFGAKLPESPLADYYEIEAKSAQKEAAKRPETKARDQEIRDRLEPAERKLFEELRNQKEQLNRISKERARTSGLPENDRISSLHDYQVRKFDETLEELKNVQYEMKYGRPRPTEAEIDDQIQKAIKKYEEGIKAPTEESKKALDRQLELDRKYIERSEKLIDRGELPGEIRPDTFLKMKQKYLNAYESAIKDAKEVIKELKGAKDAETLKVVHENKELIKSLENRVKRLKADVVNQTDKIKALRALEKPSGAFYKNQIKSLKKDDALFRGDLFKQRRIKGKEEFKAGRAFEKVRPEIEKGKEFVKNPSEKVMKEAADEIGRPPKEFSEQVKEIRQEVKEVKGQVEKGTVTPNSESKLFKGLRRLVVYAGGGYGVGAASGLIEEIFHINPDAKLIRYISRGLGVASFGSTAAGKAHVREFFDKAQAKELKKLRKNPAAFNRYVKNMENSYGKAKVRRVLKIANESLEK